MPDTNKEQWSRVRARTAEAEMLGEVPNQTWLWRQAKTGEDGRERLAAMESDRRGRAREVAKPARYPLWTADVLRRGS